MEITTIHVMRHGEVENPEGVLYGRLPNFRLTARGKKMAEVVRDYFLDHDNDIATVVTSPLKRARQSGNPVAQAFDVPLECDPRLIEAESVFEGMPVHSKKLSLLHPRNWRYYTNPFRPSWGESYWSAASRMSAALSSVLHIVRGREALVVSHQMPIVSLTRFALGLPLAHSPLSRNCSLASLTSFTFESATLVEVNYAEPAQFLLEGASDMTPGISAAMRPRS